MEGKNNDNKTPELNIAAFYGRLPHKDILKKLLSEIQKVNFHQVIGLEEDKPLTQKHFIFGVIKHLLQFAKDHNWNLCKRFDYIYIYNGAYWKQYSKEDFKLFLSAAAINMGIPEYDARHYEFAEKLLKQFISDAHLTEPELESGKVLINLNNGTYLFSDDGYGLQPFNPANFITYQLPFDYDESATCPMFDQYLEKVLTDYESRLLLQEFAGYIFTNLNLEKMLVLLGGGGNGKSVYFNVLNALLGRDNVLNFQMGMFAHEYNRAKLSNVLLNYSSEKGFDLNPEIFKALISGEPQQAREPYGKPYMLYNKVKFVTNCNELPRETEITDAYFRRFLIVLFDVRISDQERDIDLADKIIKTELPGVFNWLLKGLKRVMEQKSFTHCLKSENALSDFKRQADSVQLFIDENKYVPSEENKEILKNVYSDYKEFCREDSYKPLGKNRFSKRLESKGFLPTRTNNGSSAFFMVKSNVVF